MRNMSFALTTAQFKARTKKVTRRLGWKSLAPGELVQGVVKGMGLKKGERIEKLGVIVIEHVTRVRLDTITQADVRLEGFPLMTAKGFVEMFCQHNDCDPSDIVTRIAFDYTEVPSDPELF